MSTTEVLIAGGGLVGTSLALALADQRQHLTVVEKSARQATQDDQRSFALNLASVRCLSALGLGGVIERHGAPISQIETRVAGRMGAVRLRAAQFSLDSFGVVCPAGVLSRALLERALAHPAIHWLEQTQVASFEASSSHARCVLDGQHGQVLAAQLLVAADGSESALRGAAGIDVSRIDYGQIAWVSTVRLRGAPAGLALERLSDQGPQALLPRRDGRHGLIWCHASEHAVDPATLTHAELLGRYYADFGQQYPVSEIDRRIGRWPLQALRAERLTGPRLVLVGNAAQTVHPVSAQGFNLGLRDAASLASVIANRPDPGAVELLASYAAQRERDRDATCAYTDALISSARLGGGLGGLLQQVGLSLMASPGPWRDVLVRQASGLRWMAETARLGTGREAS